MFLLLSLLSILYPNYTLVDDNVFKRDEVTTQVSPKSILESYNHVSSQKRGILLNGDKKMEVLTFVTPWNPIGYNLTLEFGQKFSIVVPVWFQARKDAENNCYSVIGEDAVNVEWLKDMKKKNPHVLVAPRLFIELPKTDFTYENSKVTADIRASLHSLIQKYNFHGIFIEFSGPFFTNNYVIDSMLPFVKGIRKAFTSRQNVIIMDILSSVKYYYHQDAIKRLKPLFNHVDYAFSSLYELPNEPSMSPGFTMTGLAKWINKELSEKFMSKVIAGLPLFGFDYYLGKKDYIFGDNLIDILQNCKVNIQWLDTIQEHGMFFSKDKASHTLYYPTLYFLQKRFEMAAQNNYGGVGFWEIAQGLPYFFDLL